MSRFVVLSLLLLTTLFAKEPTESFPFLGVTVSTDNINLESAVNISDPKETNFGLRYGKQTLDWRTMFTISGNNDLQTFSIEIDKILMDDMFGYPEVRPYLGASVGYLQYEDFLTEDNNGFYLGGNFGFLIYVTDNIDADFSYHYNKIEELESLRSMQGASFGLHYFY